MKKVLVVVNNSAGRRQAIKNKKYVHKFLFQNELDFKFVTIDEINNLLEFSYDTVLIMGGDGTVNKVLPLVTQHNATLGILPCGTANLLASRIGIPSNIKKALKIIELEKIQKIDIAQINGKYSILRVGFGYDSDIICKTPQSLKNKFGYFAYFVAGILFALRLKRKHFEIILDNQEKNIDASCLIIANADNMYRNIFSVGRNSKIDDGLLDIFILKTQNPILFFIEFMKILFNYKKNNVLGEYYKATNINIKNKWACFHIDGEKTKLSDDIEISVKSEFVNVIKY